MPAAVIMVALGASGALAAIGGSIAVGIGATSLVGTAAATAIGAGVVSGGLTAIQGGSASDVLKSAIMGGVTSYAGASIAGSVASSVSESILSSGTESLVSKSVAEAMGRVAGQAVSGGIVSGTAALLTDKDPIEALIKGGLTGAMTSGVMETINYAVKDVPGFGQPANAMEAAAQRAAKTALATTILSGGNVDAIAPAVLNSFYNSAMQASFGGGMRDLGSVASAANDDYKNARTDFENVLSRQDTLVADYNNQIQPLIDQRNQLDGLIKSYDDFAYKYNNYDSYMQSKGYSHDITGYDSEGNYVYGWVKPVWQEARVVNGLDEYGNPTQSIQPAGYVKYAGVPQEESKDYFLEQARAIDSQATALANDLNTKTTNLLGGEVTKYRTEIQMQQQMIYGNDGYEWAEVPVEVQVPYTQTVAGSLAPLRQQLDELQASIPTVQANFEEKKDNLTKVIQDFNAAETENAALAKSSLDAITTASNRYKDQFGEDPTEDILNKYIATGNVLAAVDADILQNQQASKSTSTATEDAVVVPGAENVANLITGGGETVAGAGGFTPNFVAAMPEMQPREGEVAGDVEEVEPGIYKRTISKTLADGTVVSYDITYDPDNTNRPISYDTVSGDQASGFNVVSSGTRPSFDQQNVETGVSTDTSGQTQAEAGAPVAEEPSTRTVTNPDGSKSVYDQDNNLVDIIAAPEQLPGPSGEPSTTSPDALVPEASNTNLEAGKTPQERAAEEWQRYLGSLANKPADLDLPNSTIDAGEYWDEYNQNLKRIMDAGGYTSQWQNVNGDKVFVNDDGTAIGITQDGGTYPLSNTQVEEMVGNGLLNTADSGYVDATGGTGNTPGGTLDEDKETESQECPEGYVFNLNTRTCVPVEAEPENKCGEGFHWDEARQICVADTDKEEDDECPPGYIRNLNTGSCVRDPSSEGGGGGGGGGGPGGPGGDMPDLMSLLFGSKADTISRAIPDEPMLKSGLPVQARMDKFEGPLDEFLKMVSGGSYVNKPAQQPQQASNMNMPNQPDRLDQQPGYFNYGREPNIDNALSPYGQNYNPQSFAPSNNFGQQLQNLGQQLQFKDGGLAAPLMAEGGTTRYGRYAGGGLNVVEHSGKHRLDFRKGAAVTGEGDGQSDDIPAMLADGEFVFPADVVAALGNGSTKAGSDKLYDMMHAIRAHHRSAKPEDLPPPAKKSPLDYLNTRKARG